MTWHIHVWVQQGRVRVCTRCGAVYGPRALWER